MLRYFPARGQLPLLALFTLIGSATPVAERGVCAQEPAADRAVITQVSGEPISGSIRGLSLRELQLQVDDRRTAVRTEEIVRVEFPQRRVSESANPLILLENGDRIRARILRMEEDDLRAQWRLASGAGEIRIPLETVRGAILTMPETGFTRNRLLRQLQEQPAQRDTLMLDNGDQLGGELSDIDSASIVLTTAAGDTRIERRGIRTLLMNSDLISFPKAKGRTALVEFTDGSRLTVGDLGLAENGVLHLDAISGTQVDVPLSAVASIRFLGGQAVYLSDLTPGEFEFTPYLMTHWKWRPDQNVRGGPLRLRGREFIKGLGMHSQSRSTYALGGEYQQFRATIGIDDSANGGGHVEFAVEVDGERIYTSPPLTGRDAALQIPPIDVRNAAAITLIVNFGEFGDVQDHADWCDAVLIR